MARVPASEATRKRLKDMLAGASGVERSALMREAVRLIVEEALEAEVTEAVGRGYYDRAEDTGGGQRVGWTVPKAASSTPCRRCAALTAGVPKCAPRSAARPKSWSGWPSRCTPVGLSMRDIEAAFTDERGRSVLTRSAASRLAERLWDDYQAFASRSLAELPIVYLYVDGVAERLHLGQPREAVLVAWGIDAAGGKQLLGLLPGTKEDTACCRDFLRDLKARGLADPLLVVTDGAPGLMRAVQEVMPRSLRQRCLAHKMRNLQAKVPEERWREIGPAARAVYQAPSPALATLAAEAFRTAWGQEFPTAVACFDDDFDACIAHLQLPIAHRRVTRTTNLLERLFGEERRRTKTVRFLSSGVRPLSVTRGFRFGSNRL
jgi:putative transposase